MFICGWSTSCTDHCGFGNIMNWMIHVALNCFLCNRSQGHLRNLCKVVTGCYAILVPNKLVIFQYLSLDLIAVSSWQRRMLHVSFQLCHSQLHRNNRTIWPVQSLWNIGAKGSLRLQTKLIGKSNFTHIIGYTRPLSRVCSYSCCNRY